MNTRFLLMGILLCLGLSNGYTQSRIKLELYTGPQYSYQKLLNDPEPSLNFRGAAANHLGIGLLYRIGENWQVSLQSEMSIANFAYDLYPNYPQTLQHFRSQGYDSFGNYRMGLRRTWERGNHAIFIQPSIGLTVNKYWIFNEADTISSFRFFTKETAVVGNFALETGLKFYTKNKNYFLIGVRHQQGLGSLNSIEFSGLPPGQKSSIHRRGSYTGLVLGYGIDFKGKSQEVRDEWRAGREERKKEKRQAAWGDGAYLMATGLLRFRPKSEREPNLEFSHISGGNEFLAGYTLGSLSIESGYGRMNAHTNVVIEDAGLNIQTPTDYTVRVIPFRLRYHWDIGNQNRLRVGVSSAAIYTLDTKGMAWNSRSVINETEQFHYALNPNPTEQNSEGKIFFNAGIFTEIPIFNSSMMTFNFSRNFASPDVGKVAISGEVNGAPVNFDAAGTLNGWVLEFGYKLPLKSIFR